MFFLRPSGFEFLAADAEFLYYKFDATRENSHAFVDTRPTELSPRAAEHMSQLRTAVGRGAVNLKDLRKPAASA